MKKKHVILLVFIASVLSVSPMAFAVEFVSNSAKITNRYISGTVGGWSYMFGSGDSVGSITYTSVVDVEEVSGAQINEQTFNNVKCLKVNIIETSTTDEDEFYSIWMAQDTQGNLWILKGYSYFEDTTFMLGTDFTSMFMPADPEVDDPASLMVPENATNYCQVAEVDISVDTTFGSYDGCIKINCYWDSIFEGAEYYCPDVGEVKFTGSNPQEIMELKEYGSSTVTKTVVIPLIN